MNETLKKIGLYGIVPVIKIEDVKNAVPLAKALIDGGLPLAEVTFRTAAAADAIKAMTTAFPEMLVGAGTVLTTKQVDEAIEAGSKFIVSPGFNPTVVKYCISKGIPVTPGTSTCSEMEAAMELGLDVVKFFPAEACGGLKLLKSVSAPYSNLKFIPTGGLDLNNLPEYIKFNKILACGGSFMVKDSLINSGNFAEITKLTKQAVQVVHGFELKHVGINCENIDECKSTVALLCTLFGLEPDVHSAATFVGTKFEVLNTPGRGTHGHIALSCNSPDRARAYFENLGFEFDESSAKYDSKGNLTVIYFKNEISGFAFHLVTK